MDRPLLRPDVEPARAELGGQPLELTAEHDTTSPLWAAWDYRVALVHDEN